MELGNPDNFAGWTTLEEQTSDIINYRLELSSLLPPPVYNSLKGQICFAVCAEDYAGLREFNEKIIRFDVQSPEFYSSLNETEAVTIDGESAIIEWPVAEPSLGDFARYLIKIDSYLDVELKSEGNWIALSNNEYELIGIQDGYKYLVSIKIEDQTIPANETSIQFDFTVSGNNTNVVIPTAQPFSFPTGGYRVSGIYDPEGNSGAGTGTANLECPEALGFSSSEVADGIISLEDPMFNSGQFSSGINNSIIFSVNPGGVNLESEGLFFSIVNGLTLSSVKLNKRVGPDKTQEFVFNDVVIESPMEGTFLPTESTPLSESFSYQYQKEESAGVFVSEGWLLTDAYTTRLSEKGWSLLNSKVNIYQQSNSSLYKLKDDIKDYDITISESEIDEDGSIRFGLLSEEDSYLDLGDPLSGGSRLKILKAAIREDRLSVIDSILIFEDGYAAYDAANAPIDVHLRNFSITLDGNIDNFDYPGGTSFSSDIFYLSFPDKDYQFNIQNISIDKDGLLVNGNLSNTQGPLPDTNFTYLPIGYKGIDDSFESKIPGIGEIKLSGYSLKYTSRKLVSNGITFEGLCIDLSSFEDGLESDIDDLVVDVEFIDNQRKIITPGYSPNSVVLDLPDYGDPVGDTKSLTINNLRLDENGLFGNTVEVNINPDLGSTHVYSNLPMFYNGSFGESDIRVAVDATIFDYTIKNQGSSFNGKRIAYYSPEIIMPDGAYPFAIELSELTISLNDISFSRKEGIRNIFTKDGWTFLIEPISIQDTGLNCFSTTNLPGRFGGKKIEFHDFILKSDGTYSTGQTPDLADSSFYLNIAGWNIEGRKVEVDGSNLNIGRGLIHLSGQMDGGEIEFKNLVMGRDGTLVDGGQLFKADDFTSINGFHVLPTDVDLTIDGLYLSGKVELPSGLGSGHSIDYSNKDILLGGDGFITTPIYQDPVEHYELAGFTIGANNYNIRRDGLYIGNNTINVGNIEVLLNDVLYYPDGTIQVGGRELEDPEPLNLMGWTFDIDNIRITDLGLAVDAGLQLPPSLDSRVINFNEVTLFKENGQLKLKSDLMIPRFDFDLFDDQMNIDFRYVSLIDESLEIKETIITMPEKMDSKRIRIGQTTYDPVDGFDLGGISMDPFELWGYTIFLDDLDLDNDKISFEGKVKLPDDFVFDQMAGETFVIKKLVYHFDTQEIEFEIYYAGQTFELAEGWKVTAEEISLSDTGISIGTGRLHFPDEWGNSVTIEDLGFTGFVYTYSPSTIDIGTIDANNIGVTLDNYKFTITNIEYSSSDGFSMAGKFPLDGVFKGDSPELIIEKLQITKDFEIGDLSASLKGADLTFTDELIYKGDLGASYIDDVLKIKAENGQFVFSESFVLEDLRNTSVNITAFEYSLPNDGNGSLDRVDADWSSSTMNLLE